MNLNSHQNETAGRTTVGTVLKQACLGSCQIILAQVARAKDAIFTEARMALASQERLLRLALNEAEAQAWLTEYPHLVFPMLATEKVQAVAAWTTRQQSLRAATRPAA
jgi:hypothetical protein